jgi:hypothetical protein
MGGRYRGIDQEKSAPRTVHSLSQDKPVDLFALRRRYAFLDGETRGQVLQSNIPETAF